MLYTEMEKLDPEERRVVLLLNEVRSVNGIHGTPPDLPK